MQISRTGLNTGSSRDNAPEGKYLVRTYICASTRKMAIEFLRIKKYQKSYL